MLLSCWLQLLYICKTSDVSVQLPPLGTAHFLQPLTPRFSKRICMKLVFLNILLEMLKQIHLIIIIPIKEFLLILFHFYAYYFLPFHLLISQLPYCVLVFVFKSLQGCLHMNFWPLRSTSRPYQGSLLFTFSPYQRLHFLLTFLE